MLARRLLLGLLSLSLIVGIRPVAAEQERVGRGGAPPAGSGPLEVTGYVRVIDGDTLETKIDGKRVGIGLIGLEAPLGNTDCGRDAARRLRELVKGGLRLDEDPEITFDDRGRRMYRVLARDGRAIGDELVSGGFARADGRGRDRQKLGAAEAQARSAGRGCIARSERAVEPGAISFAMIGLDGAPAAGEQTMAVAAAPAATTLPGGFAQEVVASGLTEPTGFAFLHDGRILIAQKNGVVKLYKAGSPLTTFIDIRDHVNDYWDRGLLGIAADPNVATNGYVYLLYTYENDPGDYYGPKTARLTRVTTSGDSASAATEVTILGKTVGRSCNDFPKGADCIPGDGPSHQVGGIRFAADGTMFVTVGDASHFNTVNDNALRVQDLDLLAGKLLHVTTAGAGVSTNPFWNGDANANRSKVWTYGLRNSFRFGLRPGSDVPFLGDVGWGAWEEVNVGAAGSNLGWPCYEGNARQDGYEPNAICQALYGRGASAVRSPLHAYSTFGGASVTGGAFYSGTAYPAEFQGAYFYGDFAKDFIQYLKVDANNALVGAPVDFADATDGPVDIQLGADQNLYYLAINTGELRRIRYSAGGNRPPTVNASATPSSGSAPLAVQFSSSGTSDPDGDQLTFSWNFGDGTAASTAANPQHTYTANGTYSATLTASDGTGGTGTDSVTITVGNRAPTAAIGAPASSLLFKVGDVITYSGSATDPEDGAIPSTGLSWEILLHHCPSGACHTHAFTSGSGASGSFTIPDHGDESHFEIRLTARDSGGLTNTTSVKIQPQTARLTLATSPTGLQVVYDGTAGTAPTARTTIVGSKHTIHAPSPQGGATFASWSDGGAQQHEVTIGAADATYTATFTAGSRTCPCSIWSDSATPAQAAQDDPQAVELGVKLRLDVDGYVTGIRFYKGPGNDGTHVGSLWTAAGAKLASITFTGETASGWQQALFSAPVQVKANTTYVASYHAPVGRYARNASFFGTSSVDNAPLRALANGADGPNGVYKYGPSGFPTESYDATNYWVDVVFTTTPPASDTTAPTISGVGVQPGTLTDSGATIVWTTNEPADSQVEYGTTTAYGSTTPVDANLVTAHSVPLSGLSAGTTYHYRVRSKDAAGNSAVSPDATFTTASATPPPNGAQTVTFDDRAGERQPLDGQYPSGVIDWGTGNWYHAAPFGKLTTKSISFDASDVTSQTFTFLAGRRLVKLDAYNGGGAAATVTLRCAGKADKTATLQSGQLLTVETGWAGTCTTVTVISSNGWHTNFDTLVHDGGSTPLPPTDTTPPTVTGRGPARDATGVAADVDVTATFGEAVTGVSAATFELRNPANAVVAAAVTYDAASRTAALNPNAALAASTRYTATLKGGASGIKDTAGNPLAADDAWSFTTAAPPPPPLQTVTFDDRAGENQALDGQYPTGVIDWGSGSWFHARPWGAFTTKNLSFSSGGVTSRTFSFVTPRRLVRLKAYNGGSSPTTVTLACAGQTTKTATVADGQVATIDTGWTGTCTTVTVGNSNGWNTNFDDLAHDAG